MTARVFFMDTESSPHKILRRTSGAAEDDTLTFLKGILFLRRPDLVQELADFAGQAFGFLIQRLGSVTQRAG